MPLISSAIVNVDQDTDEPWPIEVIGHDGKAHNVTMEPGEMVLYESHSILHGRPFPLKGRFYANLFIHFEPIGHTLRHTGGAEYDGEDVHDKYIESVKKRQGGHENDHRYDFSLLYSLCVCQYLIFNRMFLFFLKLQWSTPVYRSWYT